MERVAIGVSIGLFFAVLLNVLGPQPTLAAFCGNNQSHNAFFGMRQHGDQLLYMEHARAGKRVLSVVTYPINYPDLGDVRGRIGYIEAFDQFNNYTGGCVFLVSGGVGYNYVNLHLKSQRSLGIDFIVRIFGKRF